jgi:hypothetical protein
MEAGCDTPWEWLQPARFEAAIAARISEAMVGLPTSGTSSAVPVDR